MKRWKMFCMVSLCITFVGTTSVFALENPYTLASSQLSEFQSYSIENSKISSDKYDIKTGSINYIDTKGDLDIEIIKSNVTVEDGYNISIYHGTEEVTEGNIEQGDILRVVSSDNAADIKEYSLGTIDLGVLTEKDSEISLSDSQTVADIKKEITVSGFTIKEIQVKNDEELLEDEDKIIGGNQLIISFNEGFQYEYVLVYTKTKIAINQSDMEMAIDDIQELTTTFTKEDASSKVIWSSDAPSIVDVDEEGTITAIQPGNATITASLEGKKATIKVTVGLMKPTINEILGNYGAIRLSIAEEGGATGSEIYRRQDSKIVDGVETPVTSDFQKIGETDLIYYTDETVEEGATYTYKVRSYYEKSTTERVYSEFSDEVTGTVSTLEITKITQKLKVGDQVQLKTNAGSDETVEWHSSNTSIAEVDENGLLTIVSPGVVNIQATTENRQDTIYLSIELDTPSFNGIIVNNAISIEISEILGANQYQVSRKESTETEYEDIYLGENNYYIDEDIESGKTYSYKVQALYDNDLNFTVYSDESSEKTFSIPTVSINEDEITLKVNDTKSVNTYIDGLPEGSTINWMSSNEDVATIDENGVVTALRPGHAKIVATAGGMGSSIDITVEMIKPVISLSANYNTVTLKAQAVPGANGYDIYRAISPNGPWVKQTPAPTGLTYKNAATLGTKYYYYIQSYYKDSEDEIVYSEKSDVKTITLSLSKPVVKTYANGFDSIKIVTGKVDGATGYDIYRATSKNGVYTKLKTPTKLTYIDKSKVTSKYNVNSGWTYYYKVIAYRTVNGKKVYSPTTIVTGKTIPATTKVSLSKYNNKTIKVKWNKVAGASGYEIYRALSTKGKYTKIKTITKGSTISYNDGKRMRKRRYYYKVRSYRIVNGKKVYSNYSNIPSYVIK